MIGARRFDADMVEAAARVWTKVGAPTVRPLPAVPRVESVPVFGMRDAWPPVVINVNVIEADVIVIKVVPPSPMIGPPPRMTPGPQPFACSKPKAEPNSPVVGEPHPKSISAGPAYPVASDIRRIVVARAIDHDMVRAHFSAEITGRVTSINPFGRRAVNMDVSHIMQRRTRGDAIDDRGHTRRNCPRSVRRSCHKPHAILHTVVSLLVHFDNGDGGVDCVKQRSAFYGFELRGA